MLWPAAQIRYALPHYQVIEYCKYHHKAENESLPEDEKNTWDKDFVKVDDETLFNLILAANYLDIKSLLDLTCKTVADEIKGKTPEEIRIRFNIKNDFTPEEEEEVKRENAWCVSHNLLCFALRRLASHSYAPTAWSCSHQVRRTLMSGICLRRGSERKGLSALSAIIAQIEQALADRD